MESKISMFGLKILVLLTNQETVCELPASHKIAVFGEATKEGLFKLSTDITISSETVPPPSVLQSRVVNENLIIRLAIDKSSPSLSTGLLALFNTKVVSENSYLMLKMIVWSEIKVLFTYNGRISTNATCLSQGFSIFGHTFVFFFPKGRKAGNYWHR